MGQVEQNKIEKFARFKKDVTAMDSNCITWHKNEIYYVIKETEDMICIDQFDYPVTKCWMDKRCEGSLFDIISIEEKEEK